MLDWFESMENAAELTLDEMTEGLPRGKFRCFCGQIDDLAHAAAATDSPYAPPMCRDCYEQAITGKGV